MARYRKHHSFRAYGHFEIVCYFLTNGLMPEGKKLNLCHIFDVSLLLFVKGTNEHLVLHSTEVRIPETDYDRASECPEIKKTIKKYKDKVWRNYNTAVVFKTLEDEATSFVCRST